MHPECRLQVKLHSTHYDDRQLTVLGNDLLLQTPIANLLENASKYSDQKEVWVDIEPQMDQLFIRVIDEGIGIHPDDIDRIFEPFNRGRNATKTRGHGIGLSLVERIIEFHNGGVHIRSVLGNGATVEVVLPLRDSN